MAQFDVYRNANPDTADFAPYLVDLQHGLLENLATRVVAPLLRHPQRAISRLNPVFQIEGNRVVLSTQELAGVHQSVLGDRVGTIVDRRDEVIGALDLLFTGI